MSDDPVTRSDSEPVEDGAVPAGDAGAVSGQPVGGPAQSSDAAVDGTGREAERDGEEVDQEPGQGVPGDEDPGAETEAGQAAGEAGGEGARPVGRLRRFGAVDLVMALLLALLGFSLVVQWRAVATDPSLATARQEDLVRILSDLDSREGRLRQDIADLERIHSELTTAGQSREAALEEATRRADELGILAGLLPVEGPGITVRMVPVGAPIAAATLLDAVQELRGAGAEAIQVAGGDGTAVRVVASTYFVDAEDGIVVDGVTLTGPYTLTVIGDPSTLAPALNIPGGVVESVSSSGGTVIVQDEPGVVRVSAVRVSESLRHARPVS